MAKGKGEAVEVIDKLASSLVKQGGKKVGSLVKSIFGSGSKKADDFVESVSKKAPKKTKSELNLEITKEKKFVTDPRLAVTEAGTPRLDPVTGQIVAGPRGADGRPTPALPPAAGDAGIGRVPKKEWNAIERRKKLAELEADTAARRAKKAEAGPGPIRYRAQVARTKYPSFVGPVRTPVILGGGVVATGLTRAALTKEDKPEGITADQWQDIMTVANAPGAGQETRTPQEIYLDTLEEQALANAAFVPTYPGSEALDPQSSLARQYGASTNDAMQDIARQYAQAGDSIRQRGEAGAAGINDIYGQGASVTDALAAAPSDGMGGMIPVSGDAALAGQYSLAQGQSLADYLRSSGLIDAQAAGQLAGFGQLLGPAYEDQYNLLDRQARIAADARKADRLFDFQLTQQQQLREDLNEIARQKALDARAASSYSPDPIAILTFQTEWQDNVKDNETLRSYYESKGVTNEVEYIKFRINEQRRAAQED